MCVFLLVVIVEILIVVALINLESSHELEGTRPVKVLDVDDKVPMKQIM